MWIVKHYKVRAIVEKRGSTANIAAYKLIPSKISGGKLIVIYDATMTCWQTQCLPKTSHPLLLGFSSSGSDNQQVISVATLLDIPSSFHLALSSSLIYKLRSRFT